MNSEHQHPVGFLQSNLVLDWKWDNILMDFNIGLSMYSCCHDAITVTIDRLTKMTHFSSIRSSYTTIIVDRVFMEDVVRLHEIPRQIISDQDQVFTSSPWTSLQHDLGAQLNFNLVYHPKLDG